MRRSTLHPAAAARRVLLDVAVPLCAVGPVMIALVSPRAPDTSDSDLGACRSVRPARPITRSRVSVRAVPRGPERAAVGLRLGCRADANLRERFAQPCCAASTGRRSERPLAASSVVRTEPAGPRDPSDLRGSRTSASPTAMSSSRAQLFGELRPQRGGGDDPQTVVTLNGREHVRQLSTLGSARCSREPGAVQAPPCARGR